jgi:uracil-DNA glycosylase
LFDTDEDVVAASPDEPVEVEMDLASAEPDSADFELLVQAPEAPIASAVPAAPVRPADYPGPRIPDRWLPVLAPELTAPYFIKLQEFVAEERAQHAVYPPENEVYSALAATAPQKVSVLILGQDPYHGPGQAHGMCFSVRPGVPPPPSLQNIFLELKSDLGCKVPNNGYLVPWALQGVLLLNAVLTVRAHNANSHKDRGWETFTDAVIRDMSQKPDPVVFVLWGSYARKKASLIDTRKHFIIQSAHPSPLSASSGFFGGRPFSKINNFLRSAGKPEIDWQIPDIVLPGR